MPPKKKAAAGGVFAGETFCVSGKFSLSQAEMRTLIASNGGALADTPNKSCTFLVADSMGSAKTMKAQKDGIDIVTEDWVQESVKKGKMSTDKKLFLSGGGGGASKDDDDDEEDDAEEDEDEDMTPASKKKKAPAKKAAAAAPAKKKAAAGGKVFDGLTFCVSGSFSLSQSEMRDLIVTNGGKSAATPNRSCDYLVADSIGSSKTQKAINDGLAIVTEDWVHASIKAGKISTNAKLFLSGAPGASAPADDDEDEEEDEEEEEEVKPAKRGAKRKAASTPDPADDPASPLDASPTAPAASDTIGKRAKSKAASGAVASSSGTDDVPAPKIKTVVIKGGKGSAPVDEKVPAHIKDSCHVYQDGTDVYDAMLNQTNIGNNNNKYYVIQLLASDAGNKYYVWTRWGRVGAGGQNALEPCGSLDAAKAQFGKKFTDKTKNHWQNRKNFVSYSGKYTLLERDYSGDDDAAAADDDSGDKPAADVPESKLDSRVQDLIKLICDLSMMKQQMIEVGYDANKLPLGKLSKEHVKKGYQVLQEISTYINDGKKPPLDLSNQFYSLIPHQTPGMRPPPAITTAGQLKEKIAMVESLADIELATKLLRQASTGAESEQNPIDFHHDKLKCEFTPVDKKDDTFKMVQDYVANTHGHTHKQYGLEVLDLFEVEREGETKRFNDGGFDKVKNTQLLWHGSRLTNFVGILSQGLRIAPPEAPVTGYMFGKGVYFADMVSKSANYCNASRGSDTACMLLCEVALGDMNELKQADYHASNLPAGKLSTKGLGVNFPDPAGAKTLPNGTVVPLGKEVKGSIPGSSLLYNEFIVYDVAQIKVRYLVKMKFKYAAGGW